MMKETDAEQAIVLLEAAAKYAAPGDKAVPLIAEGDFLLAQGDAEGPRKRTDDRSRMRRSCSIPTTGSPRRSSNSVRRRPRSRSIEPRNGSPRTTLGSRKRSPDCRTRADRRLSPSRERTRHGYTTEAIPEQHEPAQPPDEDRSTRRLLTALLVVLAWVRSRCWCSCSGCCGPRPRPRRLGRRGYPIQVVATIYGYARRRTRW